MFLVAALYDGALGLLFLLAPGYPFEVMDIPPPNHFGYVQFPAAMLLIFGIMFLTIALSPVTNRRLIPYGILLKVSYCGVVFGYLATTKVPLGFVVFALIDVVMGVLFVVAAFSLHRQARLLRSL